jgi:hypothetical protein
MLVGILSQFHLPQRWLPSYLCGSALSSLLAAAAKKYQFVKPSALTLNLYVTGYLSGYAPEIRWRVFWAWGQAPSLRSVTDE